MNTTILPTDIKIFYENERPYIAYKGTFRENGIEYEIEIPKMDMTLKSVENISEIITQLVYNHSGIPIRTYQMPVVNECFAEHDVTFQIRTLKAQMTKAEIEKKLGYKVDIVD